MDFLNKWGEFYGSKGVGWFKFQNVETDIEGNVTYLQISQSFTAEDYTKTDRPVCHFLAGFFVGVFKEVFDKTMMCEEIECIAKGDPYCGFAFEVV